MWKLDALVLPLLAIAMLTGAWVNPLPVESRMALSEMLHAQWYVKHMVRH